VLLRRSHVIAAQPPAARHTLQASPRLPAVCAGSRPNTHFLHTRTRDRARADGRARTHTHTHTHCVHTHTHTNTHTHIQVVEYPLSRLEPPHEPATRTSESARFGRQTACQAIALLGTGLRALRWAAVQDTLGGTGAVRTPGPCRRPPSKLPT
jgi:hypothetical protein